MTSESFERQEREKAIKLLEERWLKSRRPKRDSKSGTTTKPKKKVNKKNNGPDTLEG